MLKPSRPARKVLMSCNPEGKRFGSICVAMSRKYHTEPERRGFDNDPGSQGITRIGVICHENGHFLDLPDLYDYGGDSAGVGNFCLMAGGSWNGNYGTQPAHMSAWCKKILGWLTPTTLTT
jgi:M6 family metalloprotease-like protein